LTAPGSHTAVPHHEGAIVFHVPRKALGICLASAVALGATAAPGALAEPIDHTPNAGASSLRAVTDMRSPDARDAAEGRQVVVTGAPTWPANPRPVTTPRVVESAASSGLDWSSAGIGAGAVVAALAIAAAGAFGLRRHRIVRPGSL
jgi:hypothetical protein